MIDFYGLPDSLLRRKVSKRASACENFRTGVIIGAFPIDERLDALSSSKSCESDEFRRCFLAKEYI